MKEYACPKEQFLRDVGEHVLTVLRDDGVDRHLRFRKPGTGCYGFDLITWGGHLLITGDCGSFLFRRLHDMFEFFRCDQRREPDGLGINPQYWSEKLLATDCNGRRGGAATEFSKEKFEANIKRWFDDSFEEEIKSDASLDEGDWDYEEDAEQRAKHVAERKARRDAIWAEIESDVLSHSDNEHRAEQAAYDFEHDGFNFQDFYEVDNTEYTFHFIWCAYAIAWGIKRYDETKAPAAQQTSEVSA
ncbi:hypothetical protein [Paraburkholderia domus]|uniref:hypothetical protein n=1 Tax=Paraburkholderia domus TaxID=2793075 RepID=UPI00191256AC|nr:hypothetical protein [Paraburkholderia domus]MBK5061802.1 hypothetical protein [Burkholderia sp. R-70199]CAE6900795.1 hypothetical protein R70199_03682 [Paraburkholderia domus]